MRTASLPNRLGATSRALEGQPRDPNYMPPDAKPELAIASENAVVQQPQSTAHPILYFVLGMGVLGGGLFFMRRARLV